MFQCSGGLTRFNLAVLGLVKGKTSQPINFKMKPYLKYVIGSKFYNLSRYMEGIIDPFTEKDNILMPLFMYYIEGV